MKRLKMGVLLLALGVPAAAAWAAKLGDKLYVKARNTRVLVSPEATSNVVVVLQPGQQVTWKGASPKDKQWHLVTEPKGKPGYVFQTNLSTKPPNMELVAKDGQTRAIDPAAFVSSGAAVKALSPGAEKYGQDKGGDYAAAVKQIKQAEALAAAVTPVKIAEHVKQAGLFPVVAPTTTVGPQKVAQAAPARGASKPPKEAK
ncbi:SH3 domain-containing protein [Corallococcus praedator]|uniref:SH3 domain-containing protein n=1 Tax=Corallococcus praedator TaxID=2316724 RepID=A0ABX9QAL4_9BACT|nr:MULTISPECIES: SH3 domain-containing protein [Corallococcus]RKH15916.1 SH3 domain-containing protein [Corallococcus sp. CA047B]RKH24435.1 SH3 domain-containing protein [Corallococcus sp. CA031C]RKH98488.1 SH3 domain-containing protein [Corallococcus praedator]